jgi:hypothetical protein
MTEGRVRVNRRRLYELLAAGTLGLSGVAIVLAVAGTALQSGLGVAASSLCAILFLVPGLYFLGYARRLQSRDIALAHVAGFAAGRSSFRIQDLAEELRVSPTVAERVLRTALQEGHLRGRFEGSDRFVADAPPPPEEGAT